MLLIDLTGCSNVLSSVSSSIITELLLRSINLPTQVVPPMNRMKTRWPLVKEV